MASTKLSGIAVAEAIAGFVLFWSGFKNTSIKDTLTGLLKGTAPAGPPGTPPTIGISNESGSSNSSASGGTGPANTPSGTGQAPGTTTAAGRGTGSGSAPPAPSNPSGNVAMGKMMAASKGWTGAQWNALYDLWQRESGWSNTADTRKSGLDPPNATTFAYGIAQSRPATKYPKAGQPPDLGGRADPATQIAWGLSYIASTYGTPEGAWAHEESAGWY